MITIHYNFTDGTEISYFEGLQKKDDFTTCCLDFFCQDTKAEVKIVKRINFDTEVWEISKNNIQKHTDKYVRPAHNILKMFKAGAFKWLKTN